MCTWGENPPTAGRPDARTVVEPLQMPAPVDPIQVDQREPALPDDLEVVALDRVPPPALGDPPGVADLDVLPPAVPADRDEVAGRVELGLDRRVLTEQAGHRRLT